MRFCRQTQRRGRAARTIQRVFHARRVRIAALNRLGRTLQYDYKNLYTRFLFDADGPGEFAHLDARHATYVSITQRVKCYAFSINAHDEYTCD